MSAKDERDVSLLNNSSAVSQLNIIAKRELEDTQNKVLLEQANLSQLRERMIKGQNDFESWKKQETQKFNTEMNKVRNYIIAKQNEINLHVQQQGRITEDLHFQQKRFEGLRLQEMALKEELVKLEGQKIQVKDMIKQAEDMKSQALNEINNVNALRQESLNMQEKNKQENIRLSNLNDALEQRGKKIEEDTKNLTGLREFVEPKIRAIKDEQESLDKAKQENQNVIDELNRKISEEKILLQSVLDKKSELDKDMKAFISQKEEFNRQQLLAGK